VPVGFGLELRAVAASAIEVTGRRHIDGFVIDCDDVRGATDTLATIATADPTSYRWSSPS
jgi:hypothetical protein